MAVSSWAQKFNERRLQNCPISRRLLASSSPHSSSSSPKPLEVVLAANLRCTKCLKRVADTISRIDDVESIVVHVMEKKVTVSRSQGQADMISRGPNSTKIAAIYNNPSRKVSMISHQSSV